MVMEFAPEARKDTNTAKQHFNHFSHRHPLELVQVHGEDKAMCSCCELDILGSAYICSKVNCKFIIHDICFDLPKQIRHHSHHKHPLGLRFGPPYGEGEFTCDACGDSGHAFTYHCATCKFDLHVECASFPEFEGREDHKHPLVLVYDIPEKIKKLGCYVCNDPIPKGCWSFCCLACNCGTHLDCVGH